MRDGIYVSLFILEHVSVALVGKEKPPFHLVGLAEFKGSVESKA